MHPARKAALLEGLRMAKYAPWLGRVRVDRSEGEGPEEALRAVSRALDVQVRTLIASAEEDVGTGAEFAVLSAHRARYVQADDRWMVYDQADHVWKPEDRSGTIAMATAAAQLRAPAFGGGVKKVTNSHVLQARAAARAAMAATPEMFDRFPALVNAPNGVLDLDTGRMHEHCPSMLLTRQTRAPVGRGARPTKLWLDHVRRMTDGDDEQAGILQVAAGLALYGGTDKPQKFVFLRGQGRNGKGVFLRTLKRALGGYASVVSKGLFTQRDDAIPHEILQLRGARAAFCLEAPRSTVNAASINSLTGGDELRGRRLHGNLQAPFTPTFLPLWIVGNEALTLDSKRNEALWERCVFIDVGAPIPAAVRDDTVEPRLSAPDELEGVLAWVQDGWRMFNELGRRIPSTAAGEAFVEASKGRGDAFGRFVRSGKVQLEMGAETTLDAVADAFRSWCAQHGEDYSDPYINVAGLVGWHNVNRQPDGSTAVAGMKLDADAAVGFGGIIGRAKESG
jgi:P4 family phage/plasmid primase-like protien